MTQAEIISAIAQVRGGSGLLACHRVPSVNRGLISFETDVTYEPAVFVRRVRVRSIDKMIMC